MKIISLSVATAAGVLLVSVGAAGSLPAVAGAGRPMPARAVSPAPSVRAMNTGILDGAAPPTLVPAAGRADSPALLRSASGQPVYAAVNGRTARLPAADAASATLARPTAAAGTRYTLTVHGTTLTGQPDSGDTVVVCNLDDASVTNGFIGKRFKDGVASFTVPAGRYVLAAFFISGSSRRITGQHIVVTPQVTVTGDTTATVAERSAASRVRMVTPRPARLLWATLDVYSGTAAGQLLDIGASSVGQGPLWINPTSRPPTAGPLRTVTAAGLTSPATSRARYEYNLVYESTGGLIPRQRRVVRPGQLATVDTRYYQAVPTTGQLYMRGLLPFQGGIIFGGFFPVALPSQVTEYVSGNRSVTWFDEYAQTRPNWRGGQLDSHRGYLAGQQASQDWGGYPLHPATAVSVLGAADPWARYVPEGVVPSAARYGNTLLLDIDPFGDNEPGHTGGGYTAGHYQIDQNGTQIAAGNAVQRPGGWAFLDQVKLSPDPAVIRFTLTAARKGTLGHGRSDTLSTATRTVWTWRTAPQPGVRLPLGWWCGAGPISPTGIGSRACATEPMMTLRYTVQNLALDGTAPAGLQLVRITAGHQQLARASRITRVTARVSFDGGHSWRAARVVGRDGHCTALFTAPAGALVALRTSAADAAGGSITETITSSYAIAT